PQGLPRRAASCGDAAGVGKRMVGARGFEPPASRTRTVRSTKLSYAPACLGFAPPARVAAGGGRTPLRGGQEYRRDSPPVKVSDRLLLGSPATAREVRACPSARFRN